MATACVSPARAGNTVAAWGANDLYSLGYSTAPTYFSTQPRLVPAVNDITQISAGERQSLALKSDGTVWAWGANEHGQLGNGSTGSSLASVQVQQATGGALTNVVAIEAGTAFCLAIKNDGTVWAWGANASGQIGDATKGSDRTKAVQVKIASGGYLTNVKAISAGKAHSLAVRADGTVWSWGDNSSGQLGDGTKTTRTAAVQVLKADGTALNGGKSLASGDSHSVVLCDDGTVLSWGGATDGQGGNNASASLLTPPNLSPVAPKQADGSPIGAITAIAAGSSHTLALGADGRVWGWGRSFDGELGAGRPWYTNLAATVDQSPGVPLTGVSALSAGLRLSLFVRDGGTVWAAGDNTYYQIVPGSAQNISTPTQIKGLVGVSSVANGGYFNLALGQTANSGPCAYDDTFTVSLPSSSNVPVMANDFDFDNDFLSIESVSQPTYGTATISGNNVFYTPPSTGLAQTGGTDSFTYTVTDGKGHSATARVTGILLTAGSLRTWGDNSGGQLGDGTTADHYFPVRGGTVGGASITAGGSAVYVVQNDGTVWAWGAGMAAFTGQDVNAVASTPAPIRNADGSIFTGAASVASTGTHALIRKTDGTLWAIGYNLYGQLGDGTTTDKAYPVQVKKSDGSFFTGVRAIGAGWNHSLAILNDGTVWAWGYNGMGQVGNGTSSLSVPYPNLVKLSSNGAPLTGVTAVYGGGAHSMALKTDGTIMGWGGTGQGQIGDNTKGASTHDYQGNSIGARFYPVFVKNAAGTNFSGVTQLQVGGNHGLALKSDGSVWTWGYNENGQLGDGTTTIELRPQQVKLNSTDYLVDVAKISAGQSSSFAIKADGAVLGWGSNYKGQLATGNTGNELYPVAAKYADGSPLRVEQLYAGGLYAVAIAKTAPYANDYAFTTGQNTPKNFVLTASHPDGDDMTFTAPARTVNGGVISGSGPAFTYTPPLNFIGTDSFNYTVVDSHGRTSLAAKVTIEVTAVSNSIVTTVDDVVDANDGVTSLREAIVSASNATGPDTVTFNIPGAQAAGGAFTIKLKAANGPLPTLANGYGSGIDATTQPGYANIPIVVLDGSDLASDSTPALRVSGSQGDVSGLKIINFAGAGIAVIGTGFGKSLRGNLFINNGGPAIDLKADGPTANDSGDADTGPNGLQNYPVITQCNQTWYETQVAGELKSEPNATYALDLYLNPNDDDSLSGEAQVLVNSQTVSTDGTGKASFSVNLRALYGGKTFVATATRRNNTQDIATSEFSPPVRTLGIQSFTPTSGAIGSKAVITGSGFTGATRLEFNGTKVVSWHVDSDTQITATIPPESESGPFQVYAPLGIATSVTNFTITNQPANFSFSPTAAAPGEIIYISGLYLQSTSAVYINGQSAQFDLMDNTTIMAYVPSNASDGKITVVNDGGAVLSEDVFHVIPAIEDFSTDYGGSGVIGETVEIEGDCMDSADFVAFKRADGGYINGTNFTLLTDRTASVVIPAGAVDGPLRVGNAYGYRTSQEDFNVLEFPAPTITNFSPASGPRGTLSGVAGTNFDSTQDVSFVPVTGGGAPIPLTYLVQATNKIRITVPALPANTKYYIRVKTRGGTVTTSGTKYFTVTAGPYLDPLSVRRGVVGVAIPITGYNLSSTSAVQFSGLDSGTWTPATFVVNSDESITAYVPDGSRTGPVRVITGVGTVSSKEEFVVVPEILSFSPSSGPVGTWVTVTGRSLRSYIESAKLKGLDAPFVIDSNTQARVQVPVGSKPGVGKVGFMYHVAVNPTSAIVPLNSTASFTVTASTVSALKVGADSQHLLSGSATGDTITLKFDRPLQSADAEQFAIAMQGETRQPVEVKVNDSELQLILSEAAKPGSRVQISWWDLKFSDGEILSGQTQIVVPLSSAKSF